MVPITLDVIINGRAVPVELERKSVRNFNLRIRRDGTICASIPRRASMAAARRFLDDHAAWIERHLARQRERQESRRSLRAAHGDALPLWGELVPLAQALPSIDPASCPKEELDQAIEALYRRETRRALPSCIGRAEAALGVHALTWQVRRMSSRWGSCTPARKSIRISLGLAAYPPACLAMVVAHELVHLIEPGHGARFHALLDGACPRNRELSGLLRRDPLEIAWKGPAPDGAEPPSPCDGPS